MSPSEYTPAKKSFGVSCREVEGSGMVAALLACLLPQVDPGVDGVLVDRAQLVVGEGEVVERLRAVLDLLGTAGADQDRGDRRVAQRPRQRHLGEALPAVAGHRAERADVLERL